MSRKQQPGLYVCQVKDRTVTQPSCNLAFTNRRLSEAPLWVLLLLQVTLCSPSYFVYKAVRQPLRGGLSDQISADASCTSVLDRTVIFFFLFIIFYNKNSHKSTGGYPERILFWFRARRWRMAEGCLNRQQWRSHSWPGSSRADGAAANSTSAALQIEAVATVSDMRWL